MTNKNKGNSSTLKELTLSYMLMNIMNNNNLINLNDKSFKIQNFAPFIDASNILEISKEIELANYHIERNANAKIVLTDLSIKLTRLLHQEKA